MTLEIANAQGRFDKSEIKDRIALLQFLETLNKTPFYCELRQKSYKLSICVRGELGSVQHSAADGNPPT